MDHASDRHAAILLSGEGSQSALSGQQIVRKAGGLTMDGTWIVEEVTCAPYCHSAMLCTSDSVGIFYIIAGMLAFTIGEETITVTRGAVIAIPQGLAHAWFNPTSAPATYLAIAVSGTLA